jgi:hypothetical protein
MNDERLRCSIHQMARFLVVNIGIGFLASSTGHCRRDSLVYKWQDAAISIPRLRPFFVTQDLREWYQDSITVSQTLHLDFMVLCRWLLQVKRGRGDICTRFRYVAGCIFLDLWPSIKTVVNSDPFAQRISLLMLRRKSTALPSICYMLPRTVS